MPRRPQDDELLRLALDSRQLGVYEWYPQEGQLFWDAGVRKIWGVRSDAPIGFDVFINGVHPDDRERVESAVNKTLHSGKYYEEHRVIGIDTGVERWVASTAYVEFQAGKASRVIGVAQDVTERKVAQIELAKSEAYFRAIFETSGVGMSQGDPQTGRLVRVNEAVAAMLGYDPTELVGVCFADLTHPLDREEDWVRFNKLVRGETRVYESEKRLLTKSGQFIWGHVTASIVSPDNEEPRTVAVIQDITSRKSAELELKEASRRKDEFITMLSHELRNSLASIATSANVLKDGDGLAPESKARLWEIHDRQIKHLICLIDDLLDVTRISTGKIVLHKDSVSLADIVKRAIELNRAAISDRRQTLEVTLCRETLVVHGDPTRLVQIISNLLSNATKYTPHEGRIVIDLREDGQEAVLSVRDDGIGITPESLAHVFELFSQAREAQASDITGLGVGLSLVRGLVEAHGGTVQAFSEGQGRGSEFAVRLPLAQIS